MADTQLNHLGLMLQAALVASDATSCVQVYPYQVPTGYPQFSHPCLELYRERETIGTMGNNSQRVRTVQVAINYYVGGVALDKLETWAGTLADRVQVMDNAIVEQSVSTYQSGANLYDLAGIEDLRIDGVSYDWSETGDPIASPHQAIQLSVTMVHRYTRDLANRTILARIGADVAAADSDTPAISDEVAAVTADDEGEDGVITATGTKFTSATAAFTASHVGYYIHISDATNAANDGAHLITAYIDANNVTIGNATGLVNESSLNWALSDTDHDL